MNSSLASATLLLMVVSSSCVRTSTAPGPPPSPAERYAIVPAPRQLTPKPGELALDRDTRIVLSDTSDRALRAVADLLVLPLRAASGLPLPIVPASSTTGDASNAITLRLNAASPTTAPESYSLVVTERGATLSAPSVAGLIDGVQTVRQLLPPKAPARWAMPAVEIEDAPRFRYRGILLDVGRHYFPPEFLKQLVDLLALYKFNTLQLHLTDDQGWRLEIRKYPRLTEIGAWRKETQLGQHADPYVGDKTPHGGFYTQQQMRELVAYAAARHVTIIPEIEMPGHTGAAIAAYPELACTPGPFEVSTKWGVHEEIVCPSERTFQFMEDVLTEVMDIFPSEYIHTGGDEAPKARWKASPVAQAVMTREGLANEEQLQGYFTKRIERFLRAHGRKLLGWDEILEGGIAPEATVMSWRGMDGGITAAKLGHDVVMSPGDYAYLDFYQGDPATEPLAICCYLPLDTVYAFEPVPRELTPQQATHILGAQGNLWTEYISTPWYAEYMLLPRMMALSEVVWSPKEARNWNSFVARLPAQFARLDAMGMNYRVPEPGGLGSDRLALEGRTTVTITEPFPGSDVRYTTDGSEPTRSSPRYTAPLELNIAQAPVVVSARAFLPNGRASGVARARVSRAVWKAAVDVPASSLSPGLSYGYREGNFASADSVARDGVFDRMGMVPDVRLRGDERPENYGVRLSGLLKVPRDALYTFHLLSDDGARLRIDGDVVVDHDGAHAATEKQGQVALRAGLHRMDVGFFQAGGGVALRLSVSTDDTAKREVPSDWYVHSTAAGRAGGDAELVDSLLSVMTVEEKLGQLNQLAANEIAPAALAQLIRQGGVGSLMEIIGADTARALQRLAVEQSRLRIPMLFADDVIHGFRTIFPIPLAEASGWDPSLAERTARIAAVEAAANGLHWTYAPMVDIARDPRWGRIMEGSGEDPFLGSAFAAARVRGFQGDRLNSPTSIAATAKHFAAYGAAEGGRDYNGAEISERALRDVYLPPFRAAVCAGVQTLMAGFNEIGGVPSHANRRLLTGILRDDWGFDGTVVSDWNGVGELMPHGVAGDRATAGTLALHAGVDIDMVSKIYVEELAPLVKSGRASTSDLDAAVRHVLTLKQRLGLFTDPYHGADSARARAVTLTAANRALAREAARESIVLLENRGGLLPLRRDLSTIAVLGALAADSAAPIGSWAARARTTDAVTVLQGIRNVVSPRTRVLYARGASPDSDDTRGIAEAVRVARQGKVAIVVIGESRDMTGEASSRASIELPAAQLRLLEAVKATGTPVVVVLMNGRPLALSRVRELAPAILEAWFGGVEAGNAAADVLFGMYNPSGKLPVTFPRTAGQVPLYAAHRNTGRPASVQNRYTSGYIDAPFTPLYSLGYGLSYTTFTLGAPRLSASVMRPTDTLDVAVDVTNTGKMAGDEVVQLYLRDDVASVSRPVQELRGFQRVQLAPSESRTVHFALDARALAFHDTSMALVAEPGTFTVAIGPDAMSASTVQFRFETADGASLPLSERCATGTAREP